MNPKLHHEVTRRLLIDFDFKPKDNWLRQGTCPNCQKKELYTNADEPWVLHCGRLNKCAAEFHIKEIYPDLFESWSDRYPITKESPTASADAYLREMRGFNLQLIKGLYSQENYYDPKKDIGSATIRFPLPNGSYWERIIDRPQRFSDRKANFGGNYSGIWWVHPETNLAEAEEIWIVEGIFDAIALFHHGINAVSIMSSVNYPSISLEELAKSFNNKKLPLLIWALDNDKSGHNFIKKHIRKSKESGWQSSAAQTPNGKKKSDWNDLHQLNRLSENDIKKYRYYGELLIASSANKKALLIHNKTEQKEFHFIYENELYWFKIDLDRYSRAYDNVCRSNEELSEEEIKSKAIQESGTIISIANCNPTPLYFQENTITDESWYYFKIDFPDDKPSIKNTITAAQLSSSSEFKKRLLHIAQGAMFTGTTQQLDKVLKDQLPRIKKVQITDFIGYSKEHQAYIYNDVAIKDGKLYQLNEEDFFDIGKLSIKTINQSVSLSLNSELKQLNLSWTKQLWKAFGTKGYVALVFWFGAMFAEQIRLSQKSYPFLEIMGEPGTGKTTLIEFLWKLCGRRDYEGFDPSKSTLAARARNFSQVANMPIVLIEGDRNQEGAKQRGFDWDELKTAYNGRSVRSRGMKNNGNETYEPPFRGAIVIAQNAEVNASEAVLQRIIHIFTDRANQNQDTKKAAEELERMSVEELSGFMLLAAMNEKNILHIIGSRTNLYEKELQKNPDIKNIRIIKNHAQIMALTDALNTLINVDENIIEQTKIMIQQLALERQNSINADHPLVQEFWDVYDYLNGGNDKQPKLNHSKDPDLIAISLNHFIQEAVENKQQTPPINELKRVLKSSRIHKFIDVRAVNSAVNERYNSDYPNATKKPITVKCWVFKKGK